MAVNEMEFADRVGGDLYRLLNQREDAQFKHADIATKDRIRLFAVLVTTAEAMRPYVAVGATPEKRAALADKFVALLAKQWSQLLEPVAAQGKNQPGGPHA